MNRYFGMDTHKKFVMVAAVNAEQQVLIEPQRVEMADLVYWSEQTLTPQDSVVIEVTANTWHIYDILAAHAGEVVVANSFKTRIIAEARIKSDKIDAVILARLLASR